MRMQRRRQTMTIVLNHTIVPAHDKNAAARFFADLFGLQREPVDYFAPVRVNDQTTLLFSNADDLDPDPRRLLLDGSWIGNLLIERDGSRTRNGDVAGHEPARQQQAVGFGLLSGGGFQSLLEMIEGHAGQIDAGIGFGVG